MPDSTPNNASLPDLNKISSWTASDYASLTADFVSKMTVAQVHLMSNAQLVAPKAISGFTADQIPALAVDFYIVTGEWLNQLNEAATKAITPDQMTRLTFSSLAKLDTKHLGLLSADQVAGINDNYQWYSATWLNSLTSEAFKGIPINKLNQIKLQDFCLLDAEHIKAISSEKLAALNDGHLKALTAEQVALIPDLASLSSAQYGLLNISGLPSSFFADMSQVQYAGLTAHQISTLSLEQVKSMKHVDWVPANSATGFTAEQMASIHAEEFSSANLNKLSIASLKALTEEQVALIGDLSGLDNAHLKALTAAQVNVITGISTLSNEQFALLDLSAMSASTIAGWTVTEYSGLTAHQISTLSNEQIQAMQRIDWIPAATVTGFTAAQVSSFSNDMLSQLTTDQVAAITHLSALTSQQFGLLNISQLSKVAINYLSQTEYEGLTAQQIATLKPEQIYEMWHTSWMPDDAATAFKAAQVQSINISMGYFTAGWLNHLSIEAFQALTPAQAAQISAATMAALDNAHLQALTAEQIGSMNKFGDLSGEQFGLLNISKLSTSAINALSRSQYEGITAGQISSLSTDQIHSMDHVDWLLSEASAVFTKEQQQSISVSMGYFTSMWFNSLSDEAIKGVTAAQLSHIDASNFSKWDNNHLAALTAEQVAAAPHLDALTSDQFAVLDISALSTTTIANLKQANYAGMTAEQFSSLSTEQTQAMKHIEWLPNSIINELTAEQTVSFSDRFAQLTAAQVVAMNHLPELTSAQFGLLNISGLSTSVIANLTPTEYGGLTAKQITAFSTEQINALEHIDWIPAAAASGFTAAQASSFSNDMLSQLTADQVAAMTHLSALSSEQFGKLNIAKLSLATLGNLANGAYKGLTAAQITSLNPDQVHALGHIDWMTDAAAAGFTVQQVPSIHYDFYYATPGWLNSMTIPAFKAITPAQLSAATAAHLVGLDNAHLAALTADQVAAMKCSFYWFNQKWLNGLSLPAFQAITTNQLSGLLETNLTLVDADHAAAFTPEQVLNWNKTYYWFTPAFLNNMSIPAFQAISAAHLNELIKGNFLALDNAHLASISAEKLSELEDDYLPALTPQQFAVLNISGLSVTTIASLTKERCQGLTATQISGLRSEQILALPHLDWISAAAVQGFTAAQMSAFGNDISGLPASFLNKLNVATFASFTPTQLASMTPVTFARLDYQHFWAINDLSALSGLISSLSTEQMLTVSQMMSLDQLAQLPESQRSLINTSVESGFSLVDTISDTGFKTLMHNAVTNDASLFSFTTIESVLKDFASQLTGNLTENQFNDIKNYVQAIGNVCGSDSAISSLVNGLIGTGGASINWTATGPGERIGSLAAGSSVTQFNQLISTWFDGANAPESSSTAHVDGRPLFAKGGPSINDITQGGINDCALLSALQSVVNIAPDFIKSMIVENPNNTYSVRFFNKGEPHWVTVDGNVYSRGANSATSSWAAIVERANVAFEATYMNDINNYASLGGGHIKMEEITGDTLTSFRALTTPQEKWDTTNFEILKTAVLNGAPAQLSSWDNSKNSETGQTNLVSGHAFGIIGFDEASQDFILTNPWGAGRNDNVQGTFEASMDEMWQHGNFSTGIWIANSNGASDAAGQLVHAMAAMNTSPSAALTTAALPANMNNPQLAASHV